MPRHPAIIFGRRGLLVECGPPFISDPLGSPTVVADVRVAVIFPIQRSRHVFSPHHSCEGPDMDALPRR